MFASHDLPLTTVCEILIIFMACPSETAAQACQTGWFGPNCHFKCHCEISPCADNGKCTNDKCALGYFGPGCQYVDVLYGWNTKTPVYLFDQEDSTCNTNTFAESVWIYLLKPFRIYWLRIHVKNSNTNLTVFLNDSEVPCQSQSNLFIGDKIVDVFCQIPQPITKIVVSGTIASVICSVYISQGRNIALKQTVNQSTTLEPYSPMKAVDGEISTNLRSGSCSSTWQGIDEWWSITFSHPFIVLKVHIMTDYQMQFQTFVLQTFDEDGVVTNLYQPSIAPSTSIIEVNMNSFKPSTSMLLQGKGTSAVILCEVEIFAENWCPEGTYGLDCIGKCGCQKDEMCNLVTGACAEGCPPTFHGMFCQEQCATTCLDGKCNQRSGQCTVCIDGFTGYFCTEVCPANTSGPNCSILCPLRCEPGLCSLETGKCVICQLGYYGPECEECGNNTYGRNCSYECPSTCNGRCNKVNGHCFECEEGSYEEYCEVIAPDKAESFFTIPLLLVLLTVIPLCLLLREKKRSSETMFIEI